MRTFVAALLLIATQYDFLPAQPPGPQRQPPYLRMWLADQSFLEGHCVERSGDWLEILPDRAPEVRSVHRSEILRMERHAGFRMANPVRGFLIGGGAGLATGIVVIKVLCAVESCQEADGLITIPLGLGVVGALLGLASEGTAGPGAWQPIVWSDLAADRVGVGISIGFP